MSELKIYTIQMRDGWWFVYLGKGPDDRNIWMPIEQFVPAQPELCSWELAE